MTIPVIEDDEGSSHDDDREAIHGLIREVERGFNENDAERLTAALAQNATTVDVMGRLVSSRTEAVAASVAGLGGPLRDERASYELADLVFVRPDVAVGHKYAWPLDGDERATREPAMVALYVFVKQDSRWWIVARQNTLRGRPPREIDQR